MSILIKGIDMPENCETCELSSTDSSGFFGCCVTGSIVMRKREQERPTWCPLVELPPHGKWNWVGFNIECSKCGAMPNFDSTEPLYNFCPNCGADMRESEGEE